MDAISLINGYGNMNASQIAQKLVSGEQLSSKNGGDDAFSTILDAAMGLVSDTNTYIQDAQQAEIDFALGKITSTHELGVIQQKANLSLQYTVAIRDKVLEAYKEIMNMQI